VLRIGVLAGGGNRDDISRQLREVGAVTWFERSEALVGRAAEGGFDAVVTDLRDGNGHSVAPVIVDLAAQRPTLPVLIYARITRATIDELLGVLAVGLRTEYAVRPFAHLAPILRYMLSPSFRPGAAPLLLHHVMPHVPASLSVFIALAILSAPARRSIDEIARWSGASLRTVERRLRREGWPTAHVVLRSFTAIDAVWLMTEYRWAARRVAQVRGFSHPSSVTRLLARYAGTSPATLLEDGGFPAALEHIMGTLRPRSRD
jgi:AraC-like DNA-binding protein